MRINYMLFITPTYFGMFASFNIKKMWHVNRDANINNDLLFIFDAIVSTIRRSKHHLYFNILTNLNCSFILSEKIHYMSRVIRSFLILDPVRNWQNTNRHGIRAYHLIASLYSVPNKLHNHYATIMSRNYISNEWLSLQP